MPDSISSVPTITAKSAPDRFAAYVQLQNVTAETPVSLGGVDFDLRLEFGETTEFGFSTIDEFFVFEDSVASGTLYGTLIPTLYDN